MNNNDIDIKERNKYIRIALLIILFSILVMVLYAAIFSGINDGDMYALGQWVLEAALIPIAVLGFWYAVQEFKKTQRRPSLFLAWADETLSNNKYLTLRLSRLDFNINSKNTPNILKNGIVLLNDGDNVATWFSAHIDIPVDLLGKHAPRFWDSGTLSLLGLTNKYGGDEHWDSEVSPPTYRSEIFQSNGTLASFPRQKVPMGSLWFIPIPEGERDVQKYSIRYTIYTDVGLSTFDWLYLKIVWED